MDKSMLNRETKSNEMSDEDSFRMMYNAYKQEMEAAESPEEQKRIQTKLSGTNTKRRSRSKNECV
jgi:hypothetical protein